MAFEQIIAETKPRSRMNLATCELVDHDMEIVAKEAIINKQCIELDLGSNRITSQGISIICSALQNSTNIKRLYLSDNQLADDGACHVALSVENSTPRVLGLSQNGITDVGAQYLGEMLKKNTYLAVLGLEGNAISNRGVELVVNALKYNNHLQRLLLSGNKMITDSSVDTIIDMLQINRSLNKLDLRACDLSNSSKTKLQAVVKIKGHFELLD